MLLSVLTFLVHKPLLSYIKHIVVSPYCMHLLSIPINFWFAPIIAFHYHPIFFLCPLFSNPPHRLVITFTRICPDSFSWRDPSFSSRVKLQLRGTTTDSGTVSPTRVWIQPNSLIPQTTKRLRIVNFFHIWIPLKFTNQKILSVYV